MKTLLKRLFACCMVVCMVLTMCSVMFTVSAAEERTGTVTVGTTEITTNDTQAVVSVTVQAAEGLKAAEVYLSVPNGLTTATISNVALPEENADLGNFEVSYADASDQPVTLNAGSASSTIAPKVVNNEIGFLIDSNELITTEIVIEITYTGTFEAGTYAITVGEDTKAAYDKYAGFITLTTEDGAIVVTEAHTCTPAEAVIENQIPATCTTPGSYDLVVYCSDENCKKELSREPKTTDALGHTEAEAVIENNVDATCTTAGSYDTVVYCTVCKEEVSRVTTPVDALGHNYVDGTCDRCGEADPDAPVGTPVDPNLVIQGASLGFGTSSLEMTFRIRKSVIQLYDRVELVITPQKYDDKTYNLATPKEKVAPLTPNGNFYTYAYSDIQLYELGLRIDYQLKAYTGDELVAVSAPAFTSPATYLKERYVASLGDSTKDKFRTLIVDTLVVCDKSVAGILLDPTFSESALAGADSVIKDFDISEASGDLDIDALNSKEIYNTYDSRFGNTNSATNKVAYSVTIGKTPFFGFRVKDTKNALDHTKISFKVSYIQNKGKNPSTNEMIEEPYSMEFTNANTEIVDGSMITFSFAEIGIQDGNKDVFIEFYYDGEKVSDLTYSIESYLGSRLDSENIGALATALLKLGRSFRAYSAG